MFQILLLYLRRIINPFNYLYMDTNKLLSFLSEKGVNPATIIAIIPSCTGEFYVSPNVICIIDGESLTDEELGYCEYYIYTSQETFIHDVTQSIATLDLTEGADDQFFDYSPSCFESLLYAAHQLPPLDKANLYHSLLNAIDHFKSWLEGLDEEDYHNSQEMLPIYESYRKNIENDTLEGLEGLQIYLQLKEITSNN